MINSMDVFRKLNCTTEIYCKSINTTIKRYFVIFLFPSLVEELCLWIFGCLSIIWLMMKLASFIFLKDFNYLIPWLDIIDLFIISLAFTIYKEQTKNQLLWTVENNLSEYLIEY